MPSSFCRAGEAYPVGQPEHQRRATSARPVVRGTFSPAGGRRPAVGVRSPRTLEIMEDRKAMDSSWKKPWFMGVPSEYLEAIGQVAVCSAMLESTIRAVIWHYAGLTSELGRCFTGEARISDLLLTLRSVVRQTQTNDKLFIEVDALCSETKVLFGERAKVIHRVWGMGINGPQMSKFLLTRDASKESPEDMTLEQVREVAGRLMKMHVRLVSHLIPTELRENMPHELRDAFFDAPWSQAGDF